MLKYLKMQCHGENIVRKIILRLDIRYVLNIFSCIISFICIINCNFSSSFSIRLSFFILSAPLFHVLVYFQQTCVSNANANELNEAKRIAHKNKRDTSVLIRFMYV